MERKEEIKKADCPPGLAEPYPGKKSRNNPKGTVLTKSEFTDKSVETWVRHFENSDEYHKTIFSHKVGYLQTYLKPLKVGYSDVKEKLMAAESKLAQESEEEILTQSQNLLIQNVKMTLKIVMRMCQDGKEKKRSTRY